MAIVETRRQALDLLRQSLGDPAATFRDGQSEALEALVERQARLLVVQRTGWGKSLVYFMATRLLRARGAGPTLLISPLLALMRNQIEAARRAGLRAETMNSSNPQEWRTIVRRLHAGQVDLLLISPERLADDAFHENVLLSLASRIGLFVVDEAHCISDWGHDFRPDYRRIVHALALLPANTPVLATTATATTRVIEDIHAQLGPNVEIMRGPLVRESLRLQVVRLPTQSARLAWLAEHLPHLPGSGIIYTLTVADAIQVARWLERRNINAQAYYGALAAEQREALEHRLLDNQIKVLVTTSALGMGFDKPDLHFVIHFQRPMSLIHYYQQVGRAGRALDGAYGVLLDAPNEDAALADYFTRTTFPPEAHTDAVLEALSQTQHGATPIMLQQRLNLTTGEITRVLKQCAVLVPAPIIRRGKRWFITRSTYIPDDDKIARLIAVRRDEQARMAAYVAISTCLMSFLVGELDDPQATPCGTCAVCRGTLLPTTYSRELADRATDFLRRNDQQIEPHTYWPADALAAHGWQGEIPAGLQAQRGRALSRWGDDGWGTLVRQGKQHGTGAPGLLTTLFATVLQLVTGRYPTAFDERLVAAMVALVRDRWRPTPAPTWVTCVPSLNHPTLVPNFARRIAQELRLPFVACVHKPRVSRPQKTMQNDYQQAHNLENAFAVDAASVQSGPVLVLDDMVDSGWTFTVVAALLRSAGSGPVFPLALAQTTRTSDG